MNDNIQFDDCRTFIELLRKHEKSWEDIELLGTSTIQEAVQVIEDKKIRECWPDELNFELWKDIVRSKREAMERQQAISTASLIPNDFSYNDMRVATSESSCWQCYKEKLKKSGFSSDSINEIESINGRILKKLSIDTEQKNPIKGLVIGNVQSGKTANMAALIAMAADNGFNFFVVLSGVIENLRIQTQRRLYDDLRSDGCMQQFIVKENLNPRMNCDRLDDLYFDNGKKYLNVCLKVSKRLDNLYKWISKSSNNIKNLRVLIIDDEADQASINTKDKERTRINKLITKIVQGDATVDKNRPKYLAYGSMNYVSYTATPYANILSEGSKESLFPRNFIATLSPPNLYFGPQQIFGCEGEDQYKGVNIIREIDEDDKRLLKALHSNENGVLPRSLENALLWFYICLAHLRVQGKEGSYSLLVHTSQRQAHHSNVADAIDTWLSNCNISCFIIRCKELFEEEKSGFTIEDFRNDMGMYGMLSEVQDYLSFEEIEAELRDLFSCDLQHIKLDEESEELTYNDVHLCIDNCNFNKITEDGFHMRLSYPEKEKMKGIKAKGFIVVGGSTLSRGLTIEGLVSTYFIRTVKMADTLMQMGRWFGYRKGYELLPRIWLSDDTKSKFEFLSKLDLDLRLELKKYEYYGGPIDNAPRIMNTPSNHWMRLTSANKMRGAIPCDFSFSGIKTQSVIFDKDKKIQLENLAVTKEFLKQLGKPMRSYNKASLIWKGVPVNALLDEFLASINFHKRNKSFRDFSLFKEWLTKDLQKESDQDLSKWTIVVAGNKNNTNGVWEALSGHEINKVNRAKLHDDTVINLKAISSPNDIFQDISESEWNGLNEEKKTMFKTMVDDASCANIDLVKQQLSLKDEPKIIIYCIDGKSKPKSKTHSREPLNLENDLIGIWLIVPGNYKKGQNREQTLTIEVEKDDSNNELGED